MKKGYLFALGAYLTWGLFPVYWKLLQQVPATQLLGHRIAWSFILLVGILLVSKRWKAFLKAAARWQVLRAYMLAGILIGVNWLIYVSAVNAGFIVETSLGYFINPLLSVIFGVVFLHERLRPVQWVPIALAACGVAYLTISYGRLPWIALSLAFSFGIYGLIKKVSPLDSISGLTLETGILFLPAIGWLIFSELGGEGAFLHSGLGLDLLMVGAGLVTTIPLLMFASAVQRIPLSMVGLMQYIAPTLQFLLGVLVYREPFSQTQMIGFSLVWIALLFFWGEGVLAQRRRVPSPAD